MWEEEGASLQINWGDKVVHSKLARFEVEDMNVTKANWEYLDNLTGTEVTVKFVNLTEDTEYKIENVILNMDTKITGNNINTVMLSGSNSGNVAITDLAPEITVAPLSLDLGEVGETTTSDGSDNFVITNDGNKVLNISGITSPTNYEIKWGTGGSWSNSISTQTLTASNSETVYVRVTPPAIATYAGNIVISNDDADESTVNVSVTAEGVSLNTITDYIASYKFDNDFTDETGNYDASSSGSVTFGDDQQGNANSAAEFTYNSSDKVTLGSFTEDLGTFTISFWIYPTFYTSNRRVFLISNGGYSGSDFMRLQGTLSPNKLRITTKNGSGEATVHEITTPYNAWSHIIIQKDGSTINSWVNDAGLQSTVASRPPVLNSPDTNLIGDISNSNQSSGFKMSDLRIFDRLLNSTERTMVYDAEKP
ncbi:MAG: hypothetical protein OMM_03701 [Candidatus Magnetoglobus multicellularis str. Araruama]|uniref:LamG-like jellyroll fold domain-containing protein n=1 Tax=Candidatus Magnetoglobus multicellularis str. Araruama TaxID=890399 RepID=A0A1V1P4P5_9BACT|nr:MAG: hypothetical protein OMM_03701 [Candidatus Magnetoglobus multicellularis str. Araruama]